MTDLVNSTNNALIDPNSPGLVDGDTLTVANGSKFVRVSGRWEPSGFGSASKQSPVLATPSGSGTASDPKSVRTDIGVSVNQDFATAGPSYTLKAAAAKAGMLLGTALKLNYFTSDAGYMSVVSTECNLLTPETELKDNYCWTGPTTYDFTGADDFIARAAALGMPVRGHVLMYPDHPPAWVNSSTVTSANWQSLIDGWMAAMCPRYPNLIGVDVINEMFLIASSAPFAGGYKDSEWIQAAGSGDALMDFCFRTARKYTPSNIPLFYCDNGTERGSDSSQDAQRNNIVAAITRLKAAGVPIDGFNSQWHLVLDRSYQYRHDRHKHRDFLKALVDLGLIINITEIDIRASLTEGWGKSNGEFDRRCAELLAATLETYFEVVPASQRQHISFWEMSDKYQAWGNMPVTGQAQRPLPLDTSYARKEMYIAAMNTLLGI